MRTVATRARAKKTIFVETSTMLRVYATEVRALLQTANTPLF